MDQRMCFVATCLEGHESVSELCRHFGISRKTGHKWLGRYGPEGVSGPGVVWKLADRQAVPHVWNWPERLTPTSLMMQSHRIKRIVLYGQLCDLKTYMRFSNIIYQ
jgi:transposase